MTKVYLCSSVAYRARPFNKEVAQKLEAAGYRVYEPRREAPNNLGGSGIAGGRRGAKTIFLRDYRALYHADIVVAVGRMSTDCSWELGYAWGTRKPVVHVPGTGTTYKTSPMVLPTLQEQKPASLDTVIAKVEMAVRSLELGVHQ